MKKEPTHVNLSFETRFRFRETFSSDDGLYFIFYIPLDMPIGRGRKEKREDGKYRGEPSVLICTYGNGISPPFFV